MIIVWLPYPNLRLSVHVLDSQVLGVQISQCLHILSMIAGHREGGRNKYHSTTLSWYHNPSALALYTEYALDEMVLRGQDRGLPSPRSREGRKLYDFPAEWSEPDPEMPEWLGLERIHASHRAALLKKDRGWYSQFAWHEPPVLNLQWPGKMPRVGDSVVSKVGEVCIVHSFDSYRRPVLVQKGELVPVERVAVYSGEWRRCVVVE